jgi:P pilus assembly chaperone PapD
VNKEIKVGLGFFILLLLCPLFATAQGDLLITPRRVVLEGNRQIEDITVANVGQDTAYYNISLIEYRMLEDGSLEQITEPMPEQEFASPLLRFFPRSIELAPNESQVVRIQVRRTPNLEEGEYRSHLYFRAVPKPKPLSNETAADTTGISIRLIPIYGISIPVIVRIGNLTASCTISDISFERNENQPPTLKFVLNRQGSKSVYGDISVDYVDAQGTRTNVGLVRGLAVYTPNTVRKISIPLTAPEGVQFNRGKFVIRFTDANEAKPQLFDEKEWALP